MESANWHPNAPFPHIERFSIIVRTPDDVEILSYPPWWTTGRLFAVIGALLALLSGIFVWNRMLKRLAERRGLELADEKVAHVTSDLKVYERTRLAVELHDSLSQNLTGVSLAIRAANRLADSDPAAMRQSLNVASNALDSCRDELRNCLWDLRNQTLEESDMNEAIRQTLVPHVGGTKLSIRFNVSRERLSDNTAHGILRIIRELASNAVRHGGATEIRIAGSIEKDRPLFSVSDNGGGFDPQTAPGIRQGHFGLQGIRDRIDGFEGDFVLDSMPGKGTKATIAIRLKSSQMSHSSQMSQKS
jgi:signal transduction histidine kinase